MRGNLGYLVVGLLGALVGATEIASRYKDDLWRTLFASGALTYVVVNSGGSLFALHAIRTFGWDFGFDGGSGLDLARVLVAGLGALALFRTKLFTAAYKGESHTFGPSRLLEQILLVTDRQIDRKQADRRSKTASEVMADVSFRKAYTVLPFYAIGLLESASDEDKERLGDDVKLLNDTTTMDNRSKAQALGVAVMRLVGPDLLRQAVNALDSSIKQEPRATG